jgi:2-keto-4-pentenoate hydratase/2-oxohepta-3-ene-1,7-dioic acid hydratase in catechol pathway
MKIICVGRNYAKHAKELNNPIPKEPVIFLKPETAIPLKNHPFFYPEFSKDVHYEAEVVIRIKKVGKHIQKEFANKYYDELSLGIDFTARDIQEECKEKGLPWEKAKAFDGSAAVGKFLPKTEFKDLNNLSFSLNINGEKKQEGNTLDMIFDIDSIIAYVSSFITLKIGDLIFTGTPAGVGPIAIGDEFEGYIENKKVLEISVR